MARALRDYSDKEIHEALREQAEHVGFSYANLDDEITRRSNRRLTLALVVSTITYTALTALLVAVVIVRGST